MYPLKFIPRLVEKIWGGRKLYDVLGKPLPTGAMIGESWELYDFPPGVVDQSADWASSVVANGPLAGRTLHALLVEFGRQIHGDVPLLPGGQFPLLIKFLDARDDLSVQVHPDQRYAQTHPGAHLKNEAWHIVQAEPQARLLRGLRPGTTPPLLRQAVESGRIDDAVQSVTVKAGDCFYLPSGTIHALGGGILVAEVQTPSDTTYRLYDFGRTDPATGKPRPLHLEQAMECVNFDRPEPQQPRSHTASYLTTVTRLASCPQFVLEKVRFSEGVQEPVPYDQPVVWIMLQGQAQISVKDLDQPVDLAKGDTVLLPAAMSQPMLRTLSDCVWLEATIPVKGLS